MRRKGDPVILLIFMKQLMDMLRQKNLQLCPRSSRIVLGIESASKVARQERIDVGCL
jgi:hypothetical protein